MGGIEQRSDSCLHAAATAVAFSGVVAFIVHILVASLCHS